MMNIHFLRHLLAQKGSALHSSRMRLRLVVFSLCMAAFLPALQARAAEPLTLRYKHHLFSFSSSTIESWNTPHTYWTLNGKRIVPPASVRVDGDSIPPLPTGMEAHVEQGWDEKRIAESIRTDIASALNRSAGSVRITRTASGAIAFEGVGFPGRTVDIRKTAALVRTALDTGVTEIALPVEESPPQVTVEDPELQQMGIRELVTMGESDFHGSTVNRVHNVRTGLDRFNGHLIAQGETFSFVEVLGPVDASTGYRKELTIIGDKTLPDYGGGLCQVSSTAYRGVWEYGFPIVQRKNHSYAVHYYAPQGTDATVYPPNVDIKFLNDSPGALLMQTVIDEEHTKAYFLYYGTRDDRTAEVVGPFVWGWTPAPPPRTEETTTIPAGTKRKVGEAVNGMSTAWFRVVRRGADETVEGTYSRYEARPLFYQVGVDALSVGSGSLTTAPATESQLSD